MIYKTGRVPELDGEFCVAFPPLKCSYCSSVVIPSILIWKLEHVGTLSHFTDSMKFLKFEVINTISADSWVPTYLTATTAFLFSEKILTGMIKLPCHLCYSIISWTFCSQAAVHQQQHSWVNTWMFFVYIIIFVLKGCLKRESLGQFTVFQLYTKFIGFPLSFAYASPLQVVLWNVTL